MTREERNAYQRDYYQKHKAYYKELYLRNREKRLAYRKEYYQKNKAWINKDKKERRKTKKIEAEFRMKCPHNQDCFNCPEIDCIVEC